MNTADTLRKAKSLISDPKNWNKSGKWTKDKKPETGYFCTVEALVYADGKGFMYCHCMPYIRASLPDGRGNVVKYNDHPDTTHADIMALFDRAIEVAELET